MIVCTGGSGTIGQFLPSSVVRLRTRLEETVQDRVLELRSLGFVPSALIHLAAFTSVKEAEENPAKARDLNVHGTEKWLEAANIIGIPRFIYVSTSHVFKPTDGAPLNPATLTNATAAYGRTKADAEKVVLAQGNSTRVSIARIFSVTSTKMRDGFLFPELLRRARERDFKTLPGHQNVRDFIDAEEAALKLFDLANTSTALPPIIHISGRKMSVRELAEEVMNQQGISREDMAAMFPSVSEPANFLISEKKS